MSEPLPAPESIGMLVPLPLQLRWLDRNWQSLVVGPNVACLQYTRGLGPGTSGVYLLWSQEDTLQYIGKAAVFRRRLQQHHDDARIPFAAVSFVETDSQLARFVEAAYLEALDPPYNRQGEFSDWKHHDAMVQEIQRVWAPNKRTVASGER